MHQMEGLWASAEQCIMSMTHACLPLIAAFARLLVLSSCCLTPALAHTTSGEAGAEEEPLLCGDLRCRRVCHPPVGPRHPGGTRG